MFIKKLSLINFKNYEDLSLDFSPKVNCLTGNNGVGKTNVMDAIYYLSFCKSYFNPIDSQNIRHEQEFFSIQGEYEREEKREKVFCALKKKQKKQFKRNKKEYERLSDHIGLFPLVMISPTDSELIIEGSEVRRKLVDSIISQFNKSYLDHLIKYNKTLLHRNALLKQFAMQGNFSMASLEIWDDQLAHHGAFIFEERKRFVESFQPYFQKYFDLIGAGEEIVSLEYQSQLEEMSPDELLRTHLGKDRKLQHTTVGIHKDDLLFRLKDFPIKKFGSQGQQKSYLLALKLGQAAYIRDKMDIRPILLLDDIYDKLDATRVEKLAGIVCGEDFGQVFITDAHPDRSEGLFRELQAEVKLFKISPEGTIHEKQTGRKAVEAID